MKPKIDTILQQKVNTASDINEHLMTLKRYATYCNTITEFGVREGESTLALLASRPVKLTSYDLYPSTESLHDLSELADTEKIDFEFIEADVLLVDIDPCDMLFIDTWHAYGQLIQELYIHSDKVNKYIIMHDTVSYGYIDENINHKRTSNTISNNKKGLLAAVSEFLDNNDRWKTEAVFSNNNGLTVLSRHDNK
jgi:hypothetical protein